MKDNRQPWIAGFVLEVISLLLVLIVVDDKDMVSEIILVSCFAITILLTTFYLGYYLIHRYREEDEEVKKDE